MENFVAIKASLSGSDFTIRVVEFKATVSPKTIAMPSGIFNPIRRLGRDKIGQVLNYWNDSAGSTLFRLVITKPEDKDRAIQEVVNIFAELAAKNLEEALNRMSSVEKGFKITNEQYPRK